MFLLVGMHGESGFGCLFWFLTYVAHLCPSFLFRSPSTRRINPLRDYPKQVSPFIPSFIEQMHTESSYLQAVLGPTSTAVARQARPLTSVMGLLFGRDRQ
jgi:hypothetical protein